MRLTNQHRATLIRNLACKQCGHEMALVREGAIRWHCDDAKFICLGVLTAGVCDDDGNTPTFSQICRAFPKLVSEPGSFAKSCKNPIDDKVVLPQW